MQNNGYNGTGQRVNGFDRQAFQIAILEAELPGPAKAVAWALSIRAKRSTGVAWPSLDRLAVDSGLGKATVRRALARLRAAGFVSWHRRTGRMGQAPNLYALHVPLSGDAQSEHHPSSERAPPGDQSEHLTTKGEPYE